MANDLPLVGVKATLEDIEKFKRDIKDFNTSMDSAKKSTAGVTSTEKSLGKSLGPLPAAFQRQTARVKALAAEASGLGGNVQSLNSQMVGTGAASGTAVEGLLSVVGTVGIVVGVVGAAVGAWKLMMDALERVEPLWQARDAYAALSQQVGMTSREIIDDTARASRFTVSEYKIITSANRDLLAGYKDLAGAYPQLMELAATTAAALGTSIEAQFDKITGAIRSGSQSALEAAGVWLDIEDAQEDYAAQSGRTIEQLSDEESQLIALQIVLAEMPGYIGEMGGAAESAMTPINQLKTEIGLLKDEMLATMAVGFLQFLESIGIDLPAAVSSFRDTFKLGATISDLYALAEAARDAGDITKAQFEEIAKIWVQSRRGIGKDSAQARMREILGIAPDLPTPISPYGPISPEVATEAALAKATADEIIAIRDKLETDLKARAQKEAIALAPYLSFEETEAARERMLRDIETYIGLYDDVTGARALYDLEKMTSAWDDHEKALRKVGTAGELSTSKLKEMNKYLLYTAGGGVGGWAQAFAAEHGGQSPLQKYAKHEDPLQAALIDKSWGDTFGAEKGRAPTDAEWQAHWYEQWAPLELYPGGPIAKATGGLADTIDKLIADDNLGGLDDVFHDAYMKSVALVPELEAVKTEAEILADFTTETWTPSIEANAVAVDKATAALNRLAGAGGGEKPPGEVETPDEVLERLRQQGIDVGPKATGANAPDIYVKDGKKYKLNPATGFYEYVESLQRGGLTQRGGLYMLHPNELVLPLNKLIDMTAMRMGAIGARGGGGLNIGTLSIPVTVAGGGAGVATNVQQAVVGAIKGRGGTELMRAARRLGH